MVMEDVFLLEKKIWIWKMYSCWRRRYGFGRCILVGKEYMIMKDVFLLEGIYEYGRCLLVGKNI